MKIRTGFVANSSSTSFLIISSGELTKKKFMTLMGISATSPIADLFEQFYRDVMQSVTTKVDFRSASKDVAAESWFTDRRGNEPSPHMIRKLRKAKKKGLTAYFGWLSSDENNIQTFFCTDSFEIENQEVYFNGLECVW